MASQSFEATITIERKSKFGVLSGNEWLNMGKDGGMTPDKFETGKSYTVKGYIYNDRKYINTATQTGASASIAPKETGAVSAKAPAATSTVSAGLTKDEWAKKDMAIRVSGILQSVVISPSLTMYATPGQPLEVVVEDLTRKLLAVHGKLVEEFSK